MPVTPRRPAGWIRKNDRVCSSLPSSPGLSRVLPACTSRPVWASRTHHCFAEAPQDPHGACVAGRALFHFPSQICNSSRMKLYLRAPGGAETFPATPQRLLCRCSLLPVLEPEQKDKLHRGKLEPCTLGGYRHSGHTWNVARALMPLRSSFRCLPPIPWVGEKTTRGHFLGGRQRAFSEVESVAFGANIRAGAQGRKCGGIACTTRVAALCNSTAGSGRRTALRERPFTGRP